MMSKTCQAALTDKECAQTLLGSEKLLTTTYNTALLESATPEVREALCTLLCDNHRAAQALFEEMNSRGWYPVKRAEETAIGEVRMTFNAKVTR